MPRNYAFLVLLTILLVSCGSVQGEQTEITLKPTFPPTWTPQPTSTQDLSLPGVGEIETQMAETTIEREEAPSAPTSISVSLPLFTGGDQWLVTLSNLQFTYLNTTWDGGYLLLGYRTAEENKLEEILLRLDSQGRIVWQRSYHPCCSAGVLETNDGGIILTRNFSLLKLDSSGEIVWEESAEYTDDMLQPYFEGFQSSQPGSGRQTIVLTNRSIITLDEGGSLVEQRALWAGGREGQSSRQLTSEAVWGAGQEDYSGFWVTRDSPVAPSWIRFFNFQNFDISINFPPEQILATKDGGALLVAPVRNLIRPGFALWFARLNRGGDILWQTTIDAAEDLDLVAHETSDGGFILAADAMYYGSEFNGRFLHVLRLNNFGNVVWDRLYGDGIATIEPITLVNSLDGGFLIAGKVMEAGEEMVSVVGDLILLKIDRHGKVIDCPWYQSTPSYIQERKSPLTTYMTRTGIAYQTAEFQSRSYQPVDLESHEAEMDLRSLCVYPTPPPTPTSTPLATPMPIAGDPSELHQIALADGTFLGASRGSEWFQAGQAYSQLGGSITFQLYDFNGYCGEAQGVIRLAADEGVCPGSPTIAFLSPSQSKNSIALTAGWPGIPRPITSLSPTLDVYQNALRDHLKASGIKDPVIEITSIYRVDLQGDGSNEVVLSATWYEDGLTTGGVSAGDYSIVLMRAIVGGAVQSIPLVEDVYTRDEPRTLPYSYDIRGILDLNGDGRMEIVLHGTSRVGERYSVMDIGVSTSEPVLIMNCP
jgi:hypothetical protein